MVGLNMASKARRYLDLRGRTWWFKRDIPVAIRAHFNGRTALLQSLHTGDIKVAQERRDDLARETDRQFRDLKAGRMGTARDAIRELGEAWAAEIAAYDRDPDAWIERTGADDPRALAQAQAKEEQQRLGPKAAERFLKTALGHHDVDAFLDAYLGEADLAPKTLAERRGLVKQFGTWAAGEGLRLRDVDRASAGQYVAAKIAPRDRRTAKKHLTALRGYWDHLRRRGHVADVDVWGNQLEPARGRRAERGDREQERPFTADEMRTLLYDPFPTAMEPVHERQIRDAVFIAALSGMRLAEVVTLHAGECQNGVFQIGHGKTAAAVRPVPIHPDLEGIVERRLKGEGGKPKADDAWLFHELAAERDPGDTFGKRFARFRKHLGVAYDRDGKRRSLTNFHSFRRWFITEAEQAGQPESTIVAVVGQKEGRRSLAFKTYSGGPSMEQRRACVEAVRLPSRAVGLVGKEPSGTRKAA